MKINYLSIHILYVILIAKPMCQAENKSAELDLNKLKSIAAYHAIESYNTEILKGLCKTEWNPKTPFGMMPGIGNLPYNSATFATLMNRSHSLTWLTQNLPEINDVRDGGLLRPVDLLLSPPKKSKLDKASIEVCIKIISKERAENITEPRDELFANLFREGGLDRRYEIISINQAEKDESWDELFSEFSKKISFDSNRVDETKVDFIKINWIKNSDLEYQFKISYYDKESSVKSGANASKVVDGKVCYKYGYWVTEKADGNDEN